VCKNIVFDIGQNKMLPLLLRMVRYLIYVCIFYVLDRKIDKYQKISITVPILVQVALVICGLFICDFAYMWLQLWHFRGTYPPIYQCYWSHYMRIHYMRANFLGPYLSHITRAACTYFWKLFQELKLWLHEHCSDIFEPLLNFSFATLAYVWLW